VFPILSSVRRSMVISGLKLRTLSRLKPCQELLVENGRRTEFAADLFSVVAPRVEVQAGI